MDFEDYKTKIQKVSNLLENAKYPEDVLNSKEINWENDFQYLCMNSNINNDLVNEVIAKLAQDGKRNLIENNVKNISVGMWKDLFNKNKIIKEIFTKNFSVIIDNTGIMTYREIENFVNDVDTQNIIYQELDGIVKKLCTYDRASLISCIRTKENGIETLRKNLEIFFQKGEYDISTTYSKILVELSDIPEISQVEILEACSKYLGEMLDRETAIDNETNVLLNWIYDSMEESHMYPEQRAALQKDIDKAIMENFESILDKANYDKETIKVLKLFPCTHEKFENERNMFIENSSKLIHMTKIYDLDYEKENKKQEELKYVSNSLNCDKDVNNVVSTNESSYNGIVEEEQATQDNNYINKDFETGTRDFIDVIKSEMETINHYNNLVTQGENKNTNAEDIIDVLIKSNLYETDHIIDKVIKRDKADDFEIQVNSGIVESNDMQNTHGFESSINMDFGTEGKVEMATINAAEKQKNEVNDGTIINDEAVGKNYSVTDDTQNYNFSRSVKDNEALANETRFNKIFRAIRGFFKKIKNVISKYKTDKIGE
ncbi:MAG: hypothetical protein IJH12_07170 [Clostridia bacterium]|nr:hypothetical protein [Clostridia bacterium]